MNRFKWLFFLFFLTTITGKAQKIVGYSTTYDDRLDKWQVVTEDPDKEGVIEATWAMMKDWSEWQYTVDDQSGWIRLRNKENPNVWEVVGGGQILEVRTIFPFEFGHWQVRYRKNTYDVKTFRGDTERWLMEKKEEEIFFYTYQEGDIRDWIIENKTDFPLPLQIALTFVPILQLLVR